MAKPLPKKREKIIQVDFLLFVIVAFCLYFFEHQMLCKKLYFYHFIFFKIAELNLEALANHQEIKAAGQEPRNTTEVLQHPNTR